MVNISSASASLLHLDSLQGRSRHISVAGCENGRRYRWWWWWWRDDKWHDDQHVLDTPLGELVLGRADGGPELPSGQEDWMREFRRATLR